MAGPPASARLRGPFSNLSRLMFVLRAQLIRWCSAELVAQLDLGGFQYAFLRCRKVFARAVNIEGQHRHADWNGLALRRWLCSAARFNDAAIRLALRDLKTSSSRSSDSLVSVTLADHLRPGRCLATVSPPLTGENYRRGATFPGEIPIQQR